MNWKPIETAPKDGAFILAYWDEATYPHDIENRYEIVRWINGEWRNENDEDLIKPTHWMPLPDPPKENP